MKICIGLVLAAVMTANAAPLAVSNVRAAQRPGTRLLDVWYDVSDADGNRMNTSVSFKDGGRVVSSFSFTGDVCTNLHGGNGMKTTWDAGTSWTGSFSNLTVTVTADDGHTQSVSASCPAASPAQTVRSGKPEPAAPDSRFTDHGDGTVIDNRTGLEWVKAPHSLSGNAGTMVWTNAINFCNGLVYAGHSDWRLPSRTELLSLVDSTQNLPALPAGHPFSDVQSSHYWSSTLHADTTGFAWYVNMSYGYVSDYYTALSFYVWPVRGNQ
mgnify:CR=1 FL=1